MKVLAIDPGNIDSAYTLFDSLEQKVICFDKVANMDLLTKLRSELAPKADILVIEQIACLGMAVGESIFETVFWSGRFAQRWKDITKSPWTRVKRMAVKMHICNSSRAKDGNIRQALIDRFGVQGTKKNPGPMYGISGDVWAALAVAVTYSDTHKESIK